MAAVMIVWWPIIHPSWSGLAGLGHYCGKDGFDMLTHAKSMLISPPDVAIDHLFPPYTEDKVQVQPAWLQY
jgi:aldehyde dehydrogenase (NAD+)